MWQKPTFFVLGAALREKKLRMSIPTCCQSSNFGRESAQIAASESFKKRCAPRGCFLFLNQWQRKNLRQVAGRSNTPPRLLSEDKTNRAEVFKTAVALSSLKRFYIHFSTKVQVTTSCFHQKCGFLSSALSHLHQVFVHAL